MSQNFVELKVPASGESVTEAEIAQWLKAEGDPVRRDEPVVVLETDKATLELSAPTDGTLVKQLKKAGQRVEVGDVIAQFAPGAAPEAAAAEATTSEPAEDTAPSGVGPTAATSPSAAASPQPLPAGQAAEHPIMPAAARLMAQAKVPPEKIQPSGPGGRVLKEDVQRAVESPTTPIPSAEHAAASEEPQKIGTSAPAAAPAEARTDAPESPSTSVPPVPPAREERVVPMSLLRRRIAEKLLQARQQTAMLTTFNEIDMSAVMAVRRDYQEAFQQRYQVKLGFMSFFVKATVEALKDYPALNAEIRGTDIVYRNYHDIGIAVGGGRGLVVPVLRNAERLSFAQIELAIADFARRARENKIRPEDLQGGTFTITNGGVYGSLLSTPLLNYPQSGVLGMHAIQERPVAREGQVVVRPMMYVALSYDHRVVDGREAVSFLRRIKEIIENPVRMLIEI